MHCPLRERSSPTAFEGAILVVVTFIVDISVFATHGKIVYGAFNDTNFMHIGWIFDGCSAFWAARGFAARYAGGKAVEAERMTAGQEGDGLTEDVQADCAS